MKVAFFSPLPPARSGIADYSAALLDPLRERVTVCTFEKEAPADLTAFDIALYQIGNNEYHCGAYEAALRHPGVVVMHEANLHHLLCDITIRRKDWPGYIAECEYNGGDAARVYAERVRALEVGPDYEGLPILRRLLERSRAAIVHSDFVGNALRKAGFTGPIARIPHGAWLPDGSDRMKYRDKLGLDAVTPLIGIFGFLKPYKRIAQSLRAFRRVVRLVPDAKMILVGEPHADLPLAAMLRGLNLEANVRVIGFADITDFNGYLSACDTVLNLRYPTVGETSGTLLRSLGMGKAVVVSNVGAFSEYSDEIVLKVPVDDSEEDLLFEYMNLLVTRPEVGRQMGAKAREWVSRECSWESVADRYVEFLSAVVDGRDWVEQGPLPGAKAKSGRGVIEVTAEASVVEPVAAEEEIEAYLNTWATRPDSKLYLDIHLARLRRTLEITPPGTPEQRVLEMGAYLQITPSLKTKLGYGEVRGCYFGELGKVDHKEAVSLEGERFTCDVDLFDAERDPFPYPDGHFDTVLCCELIEHLTADPMFLMGEVNRILEPGGHLVLTTPNIGSLRAIQAILTGYHPGFFPAYIKPSEHGEESGARHSREYTPKEIQDLLLNSGFEVTLLETGPFREEPHPEDHWILHLLRTYLLSTDMRGEGIYVVGRKKGAVKDRYPGWLYSSGT